MCVCICSRREAKFKRIELMSELQKALRVQIQERNKNELIKKHRQPPLEKNIFPGPGSYIIKPDPIPGGRWKPLLSVKRDQKKNHEIKKSTNKNHVTTNKTTNQPVLSSALLSPDRMNSKNLLHDQPAWSFGTSPQRYTESLLKTAQELPGPGDYEIKATIGSYKPPRPLKKLKQLM